MKRIPTALLFVFIPMISMLTPVFPENASAYRIAEAAGDDSVYDRFIMPPAVPGGTRNFERSDH